MSATAQDCTVLHCYNERVTSAAAPRHWLAMALRAAWPDRHAPKVIAKATKRSVRTAHGFRDGSQEPRASELIVLMELSPELERRVIAAVRAGREMREIAAAEAIAGGRRVGCR